MRALLLEPLTNGLDVVTALPRDWELSILYPAGCPVKSSDSRFTEFLHDTLNAIGYDPEQDAFIVAGKISKCGVAIAEMAMYADTLRLLVFDDVKNKYVVHTSEVDAEYTPAADE